MQNVAHDPPPRLRLRECVMPALLLLIFVATLFDPKVQAVMAAAFGARPFGLPVLAVVAVIEVLLLWPLLWPLVHLQRLIRALLIDAGIAPGAQGQGPSTAVQRLRPGRSLWICAFGLVYFVVLMGGWIAYATSRGI